MRIHIVRPKETKQEGNEEVSLKSTNQVISFEQNEEVLQNDSSFTSKKANNQKPVIKKQVSVNTIGKQKRRKKHRKFHTLLMRQVHKHQRENIMNRGHQLNVRLKVANNTVLL